MILLRNIEVLHPIRNEIRRRPVERIRIALTNTLSRDSLRFKFVKPLCQLIRVLYEDALFGGDRQVF